MLSRMSIGARMVLPVVTAVLALALGASLHMYRDASRKIAEELQLKGLAIAESLANRCVEPLVTEDWWELHRLVAATRQSDPDVRYVFVTDERGEVAAHTFAGGFPSQLLDANGCPKGSSPHVELLSTQEGLVRDIAVPILGGEAGTARVGMSQRRVDELLRHLAQRFLALAALVLAGGMVLAIAGARITSRPIRALARTAEAVARGEWQHPLPGRGGDEVAALSRALSSMLTRLRESQERLEAHAAQLQEELRRRKELQQQLIQSAKLAAVGTLAAGVAHELNQPLTVIRAVAQELKAAGLSSEADAALLTQIEEQTARMSRTIEHLRTFSRPAPSELGPVSINAVVEQALQMVARQLESRGVAIRVELAGDLPEVSANANQLEQVVLNLLTNARDAVGEQPEALIRVRTYEDPGQGASSTRGVVCEVSDNGPGVPAELRERIFDPFFTTKPMGAGTGLGLAVSRSIVNDHGGRLDLVEDAGWGATFRIWLPARDELRAARSQGHGIAA